MDTVHHGHNVNHMAVREGGQTCDPVTIHIRPQRKCVCGSLHSGTGPQMKIVGCGSSATFSVSDLSVLSFIGFRSDSDQLVSESKVP